MRLFNVPNTITALNFSCGILSLIFAFSGEVVSAVGLIFLGAFFDFFDGFFARLLNQQGELGKQLDSLADVVSFGVAPGAIAFLFFIHFFDSNHSTHLTALQTWSSSENKWLSLFFILIPVFSLFRLAKFNLDTRQSESFIGLPTPANAVLITSIPLCSAIYQNENSLNFEIVSLLNIDFIYFFIALSAACLLLAELPLFSLKFKSFQFRSNKMKYTFLGISFICLLFFQLISLPFIVILYILLSIIQIFAPNTSKNEI